MTEEDKKDRKPMKILSNYEKELLYQRWKRSPDKPLTELAKEEGINYQTLCNYKKSGGWEQRKVQETNEIVALQTKGKVDLEVGKKAVGSLMKSLLKMAEDFETAIFYQDSETQRMIPFKTLAECLDKLMRLQHFLVSDGTKHNVNVKKEVVDWASIIKMSIEEKRKNPDFNDAEFAKNVIEAAFEDKSDE